MGNDIPTMRGYFSIGIAHVHKPGNMGNLVRTAHAFGASFVFAIGQMRSRDQHKFDTAKSDTAIPVYEYEDFGELQLPKRCRLVGVEITDDAIDLPSFHHPEQAAYILGGERIGLDDQILDACDHIIKIPTRFSLNVATAGAVVMYDRMRTMGRFAERAITSTGKPILREPHKHGGPISRRLRKLEKQNKKEQ